MNQEKDLFDYVTEEIEESSKELCNDTSNELGIDTSREVVFTYGFEDVTIDVTRFKADRTIKFLVNKFKDKLAINGKISEDHLNVVSGGRKVHLGEEAVPGNSYVFTLSHEVKGI